MRRFDSLVAAFAVAFALIGSELRADDTVKLAIPMRGNWENAAPDLGERAGIFAKRGLALE
jgi:hypothetical protein